MSNFIIAIKCGVAWLSISFAIYLIMAVIGALTFFSFSTFSYQDWHPVARFLHAIISLIFLAAAFSVGSDQIKENETK